MPAVCIAAHHPPSYVGRTPSRAPRASGVSPAFPNHAQGGVSPARALSTGPSASQAVESHRGSAVPSEMSQWRDQIGFTGRYHDVESGLVYFRNRYWDTGLGRFINRDPAGYIDGMSLYAGYFVPNGVDPSGLATEVIATLWGGYDPITGEVHGTAIIECTDEAKGTSCSFNRAVVAFAAPGIPGDARGLTHTILDAQAHTQYDDPTRGNCNCKDQDDDGDPCPDPSPVPQADRPEPINPPVLPLPGVRPGPNPVGPGSGRPSPIPRPGPMRPVPVPVNPGGGFLEWLRGVPSFTPMIMPNWNFPDEPTSPWDRPPGMA